MKAPDQKQIADFLLNRSHYADAEQVHAWLAAHEDELDKVLLTEDLLPGDMVNVSLAAKEQALHRVLRRGIVKRINVKRWLTAAAVIAIVFTSFWFLSPAGKKVRPVIAASMVQVKNNTIRLMHYRLPDSSYLSLVPGASIAFENNFAVNRLVSITSGDVYFRVKKDVVHPFRVIANGISTTAVGTGFWVQQLTAEKLNVSLTEGKVFVNAVDGFTMDTVFLMPGQNCTIDKLTGEVRVWSEDSKDKPVWKAPLAPEITGGTTSSIVWTNREIQFSGATLSQVFAKLENRYAVKIITKDTSVYQATITGKIFYNDSLDVLIAAICELNQLSYERNNDTIFLKRK